MERFQYVRPRTPAEAVIAMSEIGGNGRFIAGGTTLVDLMKHGVEAPMRIIDLTDAQGLDELTLEGDELRFGALVRMSAVADNPDVRQRHPMLAEALWRGASQQLRNMATLGGNVLQRTRCAYFRDTQFPCNKRRPGAGCAALGGLNRGHAILGVSDHCIAVYPGDWAVALSAADASFDVVGPRGDRTISIHDLHTEPGATPQIEHRLGPGELIVRTRIPIRNVPHASTYQKVRDRQSYAFALSSAAVALEMEGDCVRAARIAIGGLATKPWRARAAEKSLAGHPLTAETARRAGELALSGARTTLQNAFRVPLGAATVADALMIAKERA